MDKDKEKCEGCHQEFNWWDLLWDLGEDRMVCVNCYHAKSEVKAITKTRDQLDDKPKMKVKLSSCGNPDFKQNPNEPLYGCPDEFYAHVATLKGASELCVIYISKWELGGGNWDGGQVYEGKKQIARISYNGRVWDMNDKEIK